MRLYVIDDYRAREVHHPKGAILEVPPDVAAFLMVDAPGCFSLTPPGVSIETATEKAVESAPKDKMIRKAKTK